MTAPSPRDLHLYGGGLLMAAGLVWWFGPAEAVTVFGLYLAFLGRPWR